MSLLPVLHRQQTQQADCLAACVAMVLIYLQIRVNYGRLLRLLRVDQLGTPFRNLHYLKSMGLTVTVKKGDIEILRFYSERGLPPLVHVDTGELRSYWNEQTEHAVVVVGIANDKIYLNDPAFATAPQIVPLAEFELAWLERDYLYAVIGLTHFDEV